MPSQEPLPSAMAPYDCVYIPYIGVRCATVRAGADSEERDVHPDIGGSDIRTSIIDSPPSQSTNSDSNK